MSHPYASLPDSAFWSRAVSAPAPGGIDPMLKSVAVDPRAPVGTLGSCFAQHIARFMKRSGFNYFVTETPPADLAEDEASSRNYGVFSARYGNVYTVRQAVQLFDRAFGRFVPKEDVWRYRDGYVDPFRPQIEPLPLSSPSEVHESREEHLACVRRLFQQSAWLVFTLGLTEAWRSKLDGAVYPIAPGVAGGSFDPARHEFVNFSASEVSADLKAFIERIRDVNPNCQFILTVSPVPLIATYEPRHVLTSTVFSKSALRVAADEAERLFDNVIYFPSFEFITSTASGGRYYEDDLRQVNDMGVEHVMALFKKHFMKPAETAQAAEAPKEEARVIAAPPLERPMALGNIVCDEETIERTVNAAIAGGVQRLG